MPGKNLAFIVVIAGLMPSVTEAYTAAGDRVFPATLNLPQLAPADAFWASLSAQNTERGHDTQLTGTYSKTLTDWLSIELEDGIRRLGRVTGAENLDANVKYQALLSPEHEFVLSLSLDHEFGDTGTVGAGSQRHGATQPAVIFGKGLGDLPIGAWRPLAITGFAGYQVGEGTRTNLVNAGFSIQYSFPYLVSKVATMELPAVLRGLTPIVEVMLSAPTGSNPAGKASTLMVAPGFSYTMGEGWELGIEALLPANRASGTGAGVIGQVVIQLDYLLPDSRLGRNLLP
jgi:hypothetical protein